MNAQEAIEYIDREIRRLSEGIEYKVPTEREMIEDKIEALSIVLESAKLMHFLIKEFDHDPGYRNFEIIDSDKYEHAADIYVDDEDTLIVRSDVVGKIGIEEGADE